MTERLRSLRFWLGELRSYGWNPFAAMIAYRRERDYFLRWLQATEYRLGYSIEPPADPLAASATDEPKGDR